MLEAVAAIFIIGYLCIVFEHVVHINKTASALLTGIGCWAAMTLLEVPTDLVPNGTDWKEWINQALRHHLAQISEILFFLLGAMTIVEVIDSHHGFRKITSLVKTTHPVKILWILSLLTFFLSAVLDNLTTSIVMVSVLRKLIHDQKRRIYFASLLVIAANAGGAWSPIGDVTTTMLWVGGQITTGAIVSRLFLPSLVNMLVPLVVVSWLMRKETVQISAMAGEKERVAGDTFILFLGLGGLVFVPVFKSITHLPPYLGILLVLGMVWASTEWLHRSKPVESKSLYTPAHALAKIDTPSILFFLGILLAVGSLETLGILEVMANRLASTIGNENLIVGIIGLASAVVDNVPLVAASMAMYSLDTFPQDHSFWLFLAYAAGTGGSIFIIGSAAGVAVMGMEKIDFMWYMIKISWLALLGYLAGCALYLL